jgi:putative resolvase
MCAGLIRSCMRTIYSTGKAAAHLGVTPKTLQRWDPKGRLVQNARTRGRRMYSKAALDAFMRRSPATVRVPVARCRVPSAAPSRIWRRVREDFCAARGMANLEYVEQAGGSLNLNRPEFVGLMDTIESQRVSHLIIAYKDR